MAVTTDQSYVTTAEAEAYFLTERLYSDKWTDADSADKAKALLMSRRILDFQVKWNGTKSDEDQVLEWPRDGKTEIPGAVKMAQMELALVLLDADTTALPDGAGYNVLKVGPIEMNMNPEDRQGVIPEKVFALVSHLGTMRGNPSSFSVTR